MGVDTSRNLADALGDLRAASTEAREEGFLSPSTLALDNAERLLKAMYEISPRRFEVYPTSDGEIAIDTPDNNGQSLLLLCKADGGALCSVSLRDAYRSRSYLSTDMLPDSLIRESLKALGGQSD